MQESGKLAAHGHFAEALAGIRLDEHSVYPLDDVRRSRAEAREGPDRVTDLRRVRGDVRPVPRDVSHQDVVEILNRDDVVEVSPELNSLAGGLEYNRDLEARDRRRLLGPKSALEHLGDAVALRVKPRVVDRHRGPGGQVLDQRQVLVVEAAAVGDVEEGDRAEEPSAREHRRDRGRAVVGPVDELSVLVALGNLLLDIGLLQVMEHERLARSQHAGDRVVTIDPQRVLPANRLELAGDLRVGRRDGRAPDRAVVIEEIDDAQLGEVGDRRPRDRSRDLVHVEQRLERSRCAGQELLAPTAALVRGDVAGDVRGADDAEDRIADGRDRERDVDPRAVLANALGLVRLDAFPAANALENALLLVLAVRGHDDVDRLADRLLRTEPI